MNNKQKSKLFYFLPVSRTSVLKKAKKMWEIDIAREILTEKYPNYEWYLLSSIRDHTQMIFITLNSQSKLARVCLSNQKRHMTIEIYDLSDRIDETIRIGN